MSTEPLPNGGNGRDAGGRFRKGWKGGPGNPHAARVAALRETLLAKVGPAELGRIVDALVESAAGGDIAACKLLLQYTIGEPVALDVLARLEALENLIGASNERRHPTAA